MATPKLVRYGTDSSGRPIYMTRRMRRWWRLVVIRLGFEPVITQGAWMAVAGGGAEGSAGYHDGGGPLDLRVWNLTDAEVEKTIRVLRRNGAAAWLRNLEHGGFDDAHIHLVWPDDVGLTRGAAQQWASYTIGRDGLAAGGRDYHWRPSPFVRRQPKPRKVERAQLLLLDARDGAKAGSARARRITGALSALGRKAA